MRKAAFSLALLALAGMPATASLLGGTAAIAEEAAPLAGPDTQFVAKAIRDGMAEVEMGKAAAEKASHAEVKQFAERMVKDHGEANQKLLELAKKHKIEAEGTYGTPPLRPAEEETAKQHEMSGMSGGQFDRAYMAAMVEDHEKAVSAFADEAKNGKDAEVRDLASALLPALEEHLRMAKSLSGQLGSQ